MPHVHVPSLSRFAHIGLWIKPPLPTTFLTISAATDNYNVFTAAGSPSTPVQVVLTINAVEIGSTSTGSYALTFGTGWHAASRIIVISAGTIMGKGGAGGVGATSAGSNTVGASGGPAIDASGMPAPGMISFTNNGSINGGGGGGGGGDSDGLKGSAQGGGGGGGRGRTNTAGSARAGGTGTSAGPGAGGGTGAGASAGGAGGQFGAAGASSGSPGTIRAGGAAGNATNADSKINFVVVGTINGARVG